MNVYTLFHLVCLKKASLIKQNLNACGKALFCLMRRLPKKMCKIKTRFED